MNLTIKNTGSNYLAKIVRLEHLHKLPNSDRLQVAVIDHNSVIVGIDAKPGDLYVYFPLECKISEDFLSFTNSYSDATKNKDQKTKGFFNDKGRVRAVKLRGTPSEGYAVPISTFGNWLKSWHNIEDKFSFIDGTEFDTVDGVLFCEKYVPPAQHQKGPSNTPKIKKKHKFNRVVEGQFHFHESTAQLKRNLHKVHPHDVITISYKLHGTSAVFSKILVNRKLSFKEKIAKFFGVKVQDKQYDLVYSSRSVIKNQYEVPKEHQHYYKEDVWGFAAKIVEPCLEEGITIYAEIVGQTPNGRWIQKNYDYGTDPSQFEVYVYRMTITNPSGKVMELTTRQMVEYCTKYGLKTVPIHFNGIAQNYLSYNHKGDTEEDRVKAWQDDLLNTLTREYLEKQCWMCKNNVPGEGIVVALEKPQFEAYKLKSFSFLERETKELDNNEQGMEE